MLGALRSLLFVAALSAVVAGCGKQVRAAVSAASPAPGATSADVAKGRELYAARCASCHGPTGVEGGIGPSLRGEMKRRTRTAIAAAIENPVPPMPKLAPAVLTRRDVADVAAYVETL
ncbi:MAG: cytochrome c [Candidatus Eremiobacteraeota bacterium]|nr:cytochrome c [Candidatus Eremiobacteraeota bacterium]